MKIEGPSKTTAAGKAEKTKKASTTSGISFSDHLVDSAAEAGPALPTVGVAGVSMFMAIQAAEHTTDEQNRRRAMEHGHDLLDDLEDLRIGLLLGTYTKNQLMQLASRVRQQRLIVQDPQIMSILDDIALRAAVELAKYE